MELIERLEALAEVEAEESPCTAGAVEMSNEMFETLIVALREAAQALRQSDERLAAERSHTGTLRAELEEARSRTDALRAEQTEALAKQVGRVQAAMEEAQRETLEEMRRQMLAAVTERDKLKAQLAALTEKEGA